MSEGYHRILVCGQRDFEDKEFLFAKLDQLHAHFKFTLVIEGGAPGADRLAGAWAMSHSIELKVYPADWKRYGRAAGPIRNQQMLDEGLPDIVAAFYHNKDTAKGTKDMTSRSTKKLGEGNVFEFVSPKKEEKQPYNPPKGL